MSVLGYWFVCAEWLWVQDDKETGVIKWKCLRKEGPLEKRQPQGCRDCRRWQAWEMQCTWTSPFGMYLAVSTDRASATERTELPLWNAESSFTLKEKKKYVGFIALPSVDPAIYLQILLPLKSLYIHIYRGSRFLGVLLMKGGFYTATVCFVLKTQPTAF